uniref:Uncharacterized protein n=1 Tax=Anopheles melas TaxID=34690 RepID=A0A182TT36_9DIPT
MQPTRAATLNRRQTGNVRQHQRRRRHPLLLPLLLTVCWSLFGLATTAPAKRASSPFPFNVTQALARASETWQRPCGSNLQSTNAEVDSSFNRTASYINIQIQVNMTLLDLENWRYRSGTNSSATTWNDSLRKRQFKFLQPFVRGYKSVGTAKSVPRCLSASARAVLSTPSAASPLRNTTAEI